MTVVAVFEDLQVAVSDVLLTTDQPGQHIITPTTGNTGNLKYPLRISPTRLVRKYVEFSSQTGMGMLLVAGDVEHIKNLAVNIRAIANGMRDLPEHIKQLLNSVTPKSIADAAVKYTEFQGYSQFEVIGIAGDSLYSRTFDVSELNMKLPYFGKLRVIGSGANDVAKWIEERARHWDKCGLSDDSAETKMIRTMHILPSILLEQDTRSTLHTISKGVGGYYESYQMSEGRLIPLDSVLTIFASIVGKSRDYKVEVRRIFFHLYTNGWLMVMSLFNLPKTVTLGQPIKCSLSDLELFQIPPLFGQSPMPNWKVDRLAIQASTAGHTRLTLWRERRDALPLTKRFSESGPSDHRLIDLKIKNGDLVITLNERGYDHYLSRFPLDDCDPSVLRVS